MFLLVDEGCEEEECTIDQVCTFGNGTQEGLCTECSCIEGYRGTACASEIIEKVLYASFACYSINNYMYMLVYYYFQSLTHNILQMLMSVMKRMSVMLMLSVRTQMVVICVPVNQDFLEMDTTVQVQILRKKPTNRCLTLCISL